MLIVALNLASLQFARMTARSRELAVRLALGASRGRLIRQTLTESLVLATGGATLGVAIGLLATRYVSRLRAFDIPLLARVTVDVPALAAATIVALVTGIVVGVIPALQAPADPNDALKEGMRGGARAARRVIAVAAQLRPRARHTARLRAGAARAAARRSTEATAESRHRRRLL
jgi:hypothetical protein